MKMKRIFSGILAAVMSIAVMTAPLSTAIADETNTDKCTITINHAQATGTYTAYPIFVGDSVLPDEEKPSRLLINNPKFHSNLETKLTVIDGSSPAVYEIEASDYDNDTTTVTSHYALWEYLGSQKKIKVNGEELNFEGLIGQYDPNEGFNGFSYANWNTVDKPKQAETLATVLNLTSSNTTVTNTIINGSDNAAGKIGRTSAFYSAFAEAARLFMIDNVGGKSESDLKDTATGTSNTIDGKTTVTIEVTKPGYYLVEYTPDDKSTINPQYDGVPRAVRRSLVLVGYDKDCAEKAPAVINSKDTENIATVNILFNENILDKATCESTNADFTPTYAYPTGTDDTKINSGWKKNVSAGNGDYVMCRAEVTLPGNISAYDQYYLAVPIMYGYNVTANGTYFDTESGTTYYKSINRKAVPTVKLEQIDSSDAVAATYNLTQNNTDKLSAMVQTGCTLADDLNSASDDTHTEPDPNNSLINLAIIDVHKEDKFKAKEAFVIEDVLALKATEDHTVKETGLSTAYTYKLVFEFPVKFERYMSGKALNAGATGGAGLPGYNDGSIKNGNAPAATNLFGDDVLMKNYISARVVYSNNPNLKALKDGETGNTVTNITATAPPNGKVLYLDTSKDPNTLQNPVGVTKSISSANIVTYRLRVHATTDDLLGIFKSGGLEGIKFAISRVNSDGKVEYATVEKINDYQTFDEVSANEGLRDNPNPGNSTGQSLPSNIGTARVYIITGWSGLEKDSDGNVSYGDTNYLKTYNDNKDTNGYKNNNSGRFEIVGLAPGDYTIIALDETIKTYEVYKGNTTDNDWKEYALPKENNKLKTEYRFSFNPTLSETCTKLLYNTHYAPIEGTMKQSVYNGLSDDEKESVTSIIVADTYYGNTIVAANILITDYNLKFETPLTETKPDWWLGQREDVGLMSMRVTYIKKGLSLPVTGGIGTFIFFAVGGALVVISTVAIVTKFRIKREQL